jgi:hypothetical protein
MIGFLILFPHVLVSPFKTQARLEAEIVLLRHQLNVLRRRVPSKPRLTVADRLLFVWLYPVVAARRTALIGSTDDQPRHRLPLIVAQHQPILHTQGCLPKAVLNHNSWQMGILRVHST